MQKPTEPILVLNKGGNAVHAFPTIGDAVAHRDLKSDSEFYDADGRSLRPVMNAQGAIERLAVESEDDHGDEVRKRVTERLEVARKGLKDELIDQKSANAAIDDVLESDSFAELAQRLAALVEEPQSDVTDHRASWWHNLISH